MFTTANELRPYKCPKNQTATHNAMDKGRFFFPHKSALSEILFQCVKSGKTRIGLVPNCGGCQTKHSLLFDIDHTHDIEFTKLKQFIVRRVARIFHSTGPLFVTKNEGGEKYHLWWSEVTVAAGVRDVINVAINDVLQHKVVDTNVKSNTRDF